MSARYGIQEQTRNLNTNNTQRTVSLRDSKSGQIVAVGFEDNVDFDYADAIFYIHTSEKNAIDPALPALPEDPEAIPEQYKISYSGTLAFEDLWPKLGDYDMNDVMVKYTHLRNRRQVYLTALRRLSAKRIWISIAQPLKQQCQECKNNGA